jgi:hypothetical protein
MVVSPDVGGVVRARALAKRINTPLAIIDKRRERAGESEVMNIIGDVEGKSCILIDDIVDSGGTLCNAAEALLEQGAKDVSAYITHGVLSGGAVARITSSKLKHLVITDSIQPTEAVRVARNIRVISIASLIGEAFPACSNEPLQAAAKPPPARVSQPITVAAARRATQIVVAHAHKADVLERVRIKPPQHPVRLPAHVPVSQRRQQRTGIDGQLHFVTTVSR